MRQLIVGAALCAVVASAGSLSAAEAPGKHVDIGYYQSDDPGLMLLVR